MINEEQFLLLAARKLAQQATTAELQELEDLLQAHEHLKARFLLLQQYFTDASVQSAADTEQALERTLVKIRAGKEEQPVVVAHRKRWKWMAAAAVLAGVAVTALLLWPRYRAENTLAQLAPPDTAQWLTRQNGKATRAVVELVDGSKVWLNADSKMTYPPVFGKSSREVFLSGEAFFNVTGSPDRPFIIHLAQGTVKVLGTSFNVRAYGNEAVQTSVTSGKVAFIPKYTNNQQADTFLITPDKKVIYNQQKGAVETTETVSADDKAWTEGRLVFKDVTLEEICQELERTFGKKIKIESAAAREFRLTGSFSNNNLQEIMYYLARSKAFKYTLTDSLLVISE